MRPWYRNPARSKTTRSTPAARARWAIRRPTRVASSDLLPSDARRSVSRSDAGELRGILELEADPARGVDLDEVAVAEAQLELLADEDGAIADARDLEALAVARGHADHHVVHERPRQAVQLLVGLRLARSR